MVTRAQFLGSGALALVAASMGASAASAADSDSSRLLIATEHGVIADGKTPTNQRIAELSKSLGEKGGGTIVFPPGQYAVDSKGIELHHQVNIVGMGEATQFVPVGTWDELAGVFRIGTDKTPNQTPVYRAGLHDLSIKPNRDPLKHTEPMPNVVGILFNTFNGDNPPEPDAAHRISGITIWDLDMGIKIKGKDDQGMTVERIRGRRFLRSALVVGEDSIPGGADNMFSMIDFSSANISTLDAATIEVYASNTSWSQVKAWYSKCDVLQENDTKNGAGFYVKGTRNTFNQCDAQDNGGHGFVVKYGNNSFVNCVADSNGWDENLSGKAKGGTAHGFHVSQDAPGVQLIGCMAFNRSPKKAAQGTGFWVHEKNTSVILVGNAFDNANTEAAAQGLDANRSQVIDGKP